MRYLLSFLLLISGLNGFSQDADFKDLLSLFNKGKGNQINNSLALKYFDFKTNDEQNELGYRKLFTQEIAFKNDYFIGLVAYSDCGAGGICKSSNLRIFDYNGNLLDELSSYESQFADCMNDYSRTCAFSTDSILIIVIQKTIGDCIEDTIYTNNVETKIINIDKKGKLKEGLTTVIDTRRDNYELSTRIYRDKDLTSKSKEELAILMNEIFAAHGYIFKTDKWKTYFENFSWYIQQDGDVNEKLSLIEKENIKMIQKYEKM